MRRLFLFLALAALSTGTVSAQEEVVADTVAASHECHKACLRFGYLSVDAVMKAMPEYEAAQQTIAELADKYDAEAKRVEQDFNNKYEEFLDGQRDFPPTILQKRQMELQELMEKNVAFRNESRKMLEKARKDILVPLKEKVNAAINNVATEQGLAFVLNSDGEALPFVSAAVGVDITEAVTEALR